MFGWLLPIAAVILAALSPVLWDLTPGTEFEDRVGEPLFWFFVAVVCLAVIVTIIQGVQSMKRAAAVRHGLTSFNHSLGDTVRSLEVLLDSDRGHRARRAFFKSMVSESKSLIALEHPRVCVYELDGREGDRGTEFYLRLAEAGGRTDPPRGSFDANTKHGRAAIKVAMGTLHKCVDDPRPGKAPIEVDRDPDALWQSFMMVPLRVNNQPRGLLTIDTTKQTSFTSDHIAVALTIKSFIEIGMKDVAEAAENTQPEVTEALRKLGVNVTSATLGAGVNVAAGESAAKLPEDDVEFVTSGGERHDNN